MANRLYQDEDEGWAQFHISGIYVTQALQNNEHFTFQMRKKNRLQITVKEQHSLPEGMPDSG